MPRSWMGLLACATGLLVGFQDPDDGLPPAGTPASRPRVMVPGRSGGADAESVELAGLDKGVRAEVLTWDRAYKLAIVRARTEPRTGPRLATALDPRRLDEEARRVAFGDFARFRGDVTDAHGDGPRAFRDPAPALLELARHARAYEDVRRSVRAHERYVLAVVEHAKGDPGPGREPGMSRLDEAVQEARKEMLAKTRRYRDALDAMKVELGLAPEAAVVPDRAILAAFGEVFEAGEAWIEGTDRGLGRLDRIALEMPRLDDVAVEGRSIFDELRRQSLRIEDLLRAAARVATARRDARGGGRRAEDDDAALTLRVRREVRLIHETWLDYHIEMREFVLLIRQVEKARGAALDRPPVGTVPGPRSMSDLLDVRARLLRVEDRLVAGWVAYQVRRLALLRDLGTPPADDWPGLFAALTARKADPGAPAVP